MFKIESYITSIILANADKYIKNFRKEDAQVSLWEGDATFHNIDLNVDALNEEIQSLFVFTSGYIRDLTIHVPWTKLMSESVTIFVNTIECVVKLKSKDEKLLPTKKKLEDTSNVKFRDSIDEKNSPDELQPSSSYSSSLTTKIMNNLSIRCENIILKLVEEDIVFSMNIEKLYYENVNEQWIPTITDFNLEKLLTRKLITLSGVTICLDKQNSSGRIETYLEPLLYRCLINIRLLRGYDRTISKKPVYTHMDVLSEKMLFTVCEPQLPMLLKLGILLFRSSNGYSPNAENTGFKVENSFLNSDSDVGYDENFDETKEETSWGNWLWSMVPAILPQDDDSIFQNQREINSILSVGFCVKCLEISLKVLDIKPKKKLKHDFKNLLKCTFSGCRYQITMKNSEWLNVQLGVSYVVIEMPVNELDGENYPVFISGTENSSDFITNTLFNEKFDFFALKMHTKVNKIDAEDGTNRLPESFENTNLNFIHAIEFSIETHLNLYTENTLLEITPAFAMDYLKIQRKIKPVVTSSTEYENENYVNQNYEENSEAENNSTESMQKRIDNTVLLRLVFGSSLTKITSDLITRATYLYKIIPYNNDYTDYRQSATNILNNPNELNSYPLNYTTQFTFFDLTVELYPSPSPTYVASSSRNDVMFIDIPETFSSCHPSPILSFQCKCIDGSTEFRRDLTSASDYEESKKTTSLKAVEILCSLLQSNQKCNLFMCEKLNAECEKNVNGECKELHLETKNVMFSSSKPNLLLAYYIVIYLSSCNELLEKKQTYYRNIFFTSLIDDASLLSNTVLEAVLENIVFTYKSIQETYNIKISLNRCKIYANNLRNDVQKRILAFNTLESTKESSCIKLTLQYCANCNAECSYPSCIWFNFNNLKINVDLIFYQWILYEPVFNEQQKSCSKVNKNSREHSISKSGPNRKISDASSGSHSRKYGLAYPKPKESVHSNSEPEIHSPPEITDTETSDLFQTADDIPIIDEPLNYIQYLANNVQHWSKLFIHGEISCVTVYMPIGCTDVELVDSCKYNTSYEKNCGIFMFDLKSIKVKCDLPCNILEEVHSNTLISVSKISWPIGKLSFPWNISVVDFSISTLSGDISKPLLKPLSVNCTIGVTLREDSKNEVVIALCVHFDFQPIGFCLNNNQVQLIANVYSLLKNVHKISKDTTSSELAIKGITIKSLNADNLVTENRIQNRLTGWIQWTFAKCSLTLYHRIDEKLSKLLIETEDSIVSLEFDDIFHKLKIKLASFGIFHRIKYSDNESWQNGPFCGVIVQRCYSQPPNSNKTTDDDMDDRFLLATITRARSSNLKTKLSLSPATSDISVSSARDHFVTEVILKMSPVDFIIPLVVIDKFLSVLKPLISLNQTLSHNFASQHESRSSGTDASFVCFPLIYFDIPMIRIFIPINTKPENDLIRYCNTFICEIGSIHADCHPENPVVRKQLNPDLYYSVSTKRYASIEQKLQNQQYQLLAFDISINTSIWDEIEQMLIKEQISVEEPPSVLEQNPAVMWNQGCQPDVKKKIDLKHVSPIISKFSCYVLIAPPVKCHSLKTATLGAFFEVNVLTELDITISSDQIPLLIALYQEYIDCLSPHMTYNEKEIIDFYSFPPKLNGGQSRLTDSGLESMEQSSVGSSTVSKVKYTTQLPVVHQMNSKTVNQNASAKTSNTCQLSGSTYKNDIFKEAYITARSIRFTLYKTSANYEVNEKKIIYSGILFSEIIQPYVLINNENKDYTLQIGVFNFSTYIPDFRHDTSFLEIPNEKKFYLKLVDVKMSKYDSYSKIKNECFILKMALNMSKKWKVNCNVGQPIFIDSSADIVQYILANTNTCLQEYENYVNLFKANPHWETYLRETDDAKKLKLINQIRNQFNSICSFNLSTNRIVTIFKSKNAERSLILNVDELRVVAKSPDNIKNSTETISVQCDLKSVVLSLPKICSSKILSNILSADCGTLMNENILSNLILKPWDINVECFLMWQRWNLFKDDPWKCVKLNSDSIIFSISPLYLDEISKIVFSYTSLFENYSVSDDSENFECAEENSGINSEFYKDDLRAGAFQYVKIENDKCDLPSPYEVVFCNRQIQPYISWKYPQPRTLTKLQIYPVPMEDTDEDYAENSIRCQLQYYNEVTNLFQPYVSFNLCENVIQNVTLPEEKPRMIAAECWRIILFEYLNSEEKYDLKIDVKLLAGCVRVDSMFLSSLLPSFQLLLNVSEIQLHFSSLSRVENIMIEQYSTVQVPEEQLFLSLMSSDVKICLSKYNTETIVKFSGISKANILNYEYLMLQSFIDPFFSEIILYVTKDAEYKLFSLFKIIHLRISPNVVHTLSVAQNLWNDWKFDVALPWKITAPYIICNNTNNFITFCQQDVSEEISLQLPPFYCHLFAWHNPAAPKNLIITVLSGKNKKYVSDPLYINKVGCHAVTCINEDNESSLLFVSVIKHSSVVYQVIIRGSLLVYNLTCSQMDLCIVSYGKEDTKNKLSSAQIITKAPSSRNQLLSVVIPVHHKLSFKVRYRSVQSDCEHEHWSGLIPLIISEKPCNHMSWMVKIPLRNHKEHFQSFWCQLIWEIVEGLPKYLVVFRPLCSVVSFLPWKIQLKIFNDLDSVINSTTISDKGGSTDLFIPDTISLNKYTVECMLGENSENRLSKIKFDTFAKQKKRETEISIDSLINEITAEFKNNEWPFVNSEMAQFSWKTDQIFKINPTIKVLRDEENGCGTKIEIYPWAIIVNTFSYPVILDISDSIYTIDCYEIIAPPCIEHTFKLGLIENGRNYLSGILQLSDDQSFPIPRVTGRIPMNGFSTTMIDCNNYVTILNISSKNYKEMRMINVCSSYVINNNSSLNISCSAWVVCRSGNKTSTSFDIPFISLDKCISLKAKENSAVGHSITKWYKIGSGDVQVLPYLILSIDDNIACPVRICDLSEKQQYPIIFSSTKSFSTHKLPCIFITAQQIEGQVFLTIWEETIPHVTIHNMSQLELNVISSKSEKGIERVSYCHDWNWKFCVASQSSAHFHIHKQISEKNKKQIVEYLMFSVGSNKHVKERKWSCGVPLIPCSNQLITLPLSQHHIKLAIFRNGFTYVVWIESATSDELSAKMIRSRLSESFLPIKDGAVITITREDENIEIEENYEVPGNLKKYYEKNIIKSFATNIFIEEVSLTLAYNNELTNEESDITSFNAKNVFITFKSFQKPNEVTEDFQCQIEVESYQLDNDEYYLRTFDFPVVLLSKPSITEKPGTKYLLEDLLQNSNDRENSALKIKLTFQLDSVFKVDIRDVEFNINHQTVYIEDKYILKLRTACENIFSATMDSSNLEKRPYNLMIYDKDSVKFKRIRNFNNSAPANATDKETDGDLKMTLAKSSSSKSVNVSECDTDDKSSASLMVPESSVNKNEDCSLKPTLVDNDDESTLKEIRFQTQCNESHNCTMIPKNIIERSRRIAKPLRLRNVYISSFNVTVSLHTSTTFYIALDRSPMKFSEFKNEYMVTTPFEMGNLLVVHYFMGAVYGTGWAISSLEFVGSPGVLARDLGTGIKDFVSMPFYGIASGPRGFVLGVAHGSASLMKHVMTGTLSSVTNFAGSWARTLNRFTLDADDLLQSEQIRRIPPNNIAEGVLQGLSEFGISLLGGISGIAHHPLQYVVSNDGNRSLLNSISLGIVGVLTRPLSGAAELVARTGQGILSHVGWNIVPVMRNGSSGFRNCPTLQLCNLKYHWTREFDDVMIAVEAVHAQNITLSLSIILTINHLHVVEMTNDRQKFRFDLQNHEFSDCDYDPTLIVVKKPLLNFKNAEDFSKARILKFIRDTNQSFNIENQYAKENFTYIDKKENVFSFCVNPQVKNSLLNIISFIKNLQV